MGGQPAAMRSAAGARHAPGRAMAFAVRAAGQGASLLSSPPCAPIAEIVLRHGPVERHALARPSSSDRPEGGRRLLQPRRPALALAEYPKRIAKTGLSRGPETYRRNGGGPSRQGRLWAVATAANSPHGLRLCGEHGVNVGYTPRFW
jgi:hypothetical protein